MISKQRMQALMISYRSRFKFMRESDHIQDRANAEACHIGTQSWQILMTRFNNPEFNDFRVESVIEVAKADWATYCETGVSKFDTDPMPLSGILDSIRRDFPNRFPVVSMPIESKPPEAPESPKIPPDNRFDKNTGQLKRGKQGQQQPPAIDTVSELIESPKPPEPIPAPKINQEIIDAINPRSIDEIIETIESEFGLTKQEAEIASAVQIQ